MHFGSERYYRSSGAVPIGGLLIAIGCGVFGASLCGFGYAFVDWYNPIVYLTILATGVFAFLSGMSVVVGLTVGKVRNSFVGLLVGLFCGLVGLYVSWLTFLWIVSEYPPPAEMLNLLNPRVFFLVLQGIGEAGLWEIKGGTPKGWGLYSFWIIEAAIVVLGTALIAWKHDSPFCERCECWADDHECAAKLPVTDDLDGLKIDLENEMYDRLLELAERPVPPEHHIKMKLASCSQCEESTWLTLERIVTTVNGKGESNTSTESFIHQLAIPRDTADALKNLAANDNPLSALKQFNKVEDDHPAEEAQAEDA